MKMTLTAPAIAKLVELDPEGTVELAKGAAAQVAQEVARRITRQSLENHFGQFIQSNLREGGWGAKYIHKHYQAIISETMNAMAEGFIRDVNSGAIRAALDERVSDVLAARMAEIEAGLTVRVDEMLRERFAAMFGVSKA